MSREYIREILERAAMNGHIHICLPEYAERTTKTMLEPDTYIKAEIDDMVQGIYRAQELSQDDYYKRLDDVYNPINNIIIWLTTQMDEMKQEIYMIQRLNALEKEISPLIKRRTRPFKERLKLLEDKLDEITFFSRLDEGGYFTKIGGYLRNNICKTQNAATLYWESPARDTCNGGC